MDNLDKLRNKLQCPKSYDKYGLFRTKVLDMAYEEINNCSDILFDYEEIKTGRKVTSIKFTIKKKKDICSLV
ncbi:RepB family plasmid replication initiator protein [Clostridium sp. ZS1]|uniref:RepB family plasmid replication initiator protein n=1 Tax=Clostridium sp. ZS1 TaxID=2949989 RepID=UPI00207A627C